MSGPRRWIAPLAGISSVVVVATAWVLADGGARDAANGLGRSDDMAALRRHEEGLEPLAIAAGEVVVRGLQGELSALSSGSNGDEEVLSDLARWDRALRELASEIDEIETSDFLRASAARRQQAMASYFEVVEVLRRAAGASGDERERLLDRAVRTGKEADEQWEEADDLLNRHRHRLGLPTTTSLAGF